MITEKKKNLYSNADVQLPQRKEQQPYTPSAEVQTAKQQMEQTQAAKPGAYTPSQQVQTAQQYMEQTQAAKPEAYSSKYGAQLDEMLKKIQSPGQFKYSFDGDELFKLYADQYTKRGKQASLDAMGQASALTGGYGNTYAQQVGQQTYDQYLTDLYDKGLELRDRAYQQYQDQQNDQYRQYELLKAAEEGDYGRYQDLMAQWQAERDYATGRYDTERGLDYQQYQDILSQWQADRDYATGRYDTERGYDYSKWQDERDQAEKQYEFDTQLQEQVRQFEASLDWDKMSSDQKYAAEYAMSILAAGQMPSDALLQAAGLSAEDAEKMKAKITTGGGGGKRKTYYVDESGIFYKKDDKTGGYTVADPSTIHDDDIIDTSESSYLTQSYTQPTLSGSMLATLAGQKRNRR